MGQSILSVAGSSNVTSEALAQTSRVITDTSVGADGGLGVAINDIVQGLHDSGSTTSGDLNLVATEELVGEAQDTGDLVGVNTNGSGTKVGQVDANTIVLPDVAKELFIGPVTVLRAEQGNGGDVLEGIVDGGVNLGQRVTKGRITGNVVSDSSARLPVVGVTEEGQVIGVNLESEVIDASDVQIKAEDVNGLRRVEITNISQSRTSGGDKLQAHVGDVTRLGGKGDAQAVVLLEGVATSTIDYINAIDFTGERSSANGDETSDLVGEGFQSILDGSLVDSIHFLNGGETSRIGVNRESLSLVFNTREVGEEESVEVSVTERLRERITTDGEGLDLIGAFATASGLGVGQRIISTRALAERAIHTTIAFVTDTGRVLLSIPHTVLERRSHTRVSVLTSDGVNKALIVTSPGNFTDSTADAVARAVVRASS